MHARVCEIKENAFKTGKEGHHPLKLESRIDSNKCANLFENLENEKQFKNTTENDQNVEKKQQDSQCKEKTKIFPIFSAQFKPGENIKIRRKRKQANQPNSPSHHHQPAKGIKRKAIKNSNLQLNPTFRFKDLCEYFNKELPPKPTTAQLPPPPLIPQHPEDTQTSGKTISATTAKN